MSQSKQVCNVLRISPLQENRCCGLTKKGQPCNLVASIASRQQAFDLLGQCVGLPATSSRLVNIFEHAARLLLCKRWHQSQYPEIVDEWMESWEKRQQHLRTMDEPENEEEEEEQGTYGRRPHHPPRITASRSTHRSAPPTTDQSFERLVLSILNSSISNDAKVSILQNAVRSQNNASQYSNDNHHNSALIGSGLLQHRLETISSSSSLQGTQQAPGRLTPAGSHRASNSSLPSPSVTAQIGTQAIQHTPIPSIPSTPISMSPTSSTSSISPRPVITPPGQGRSAASTTARASPSSTRSSRTTISSPIRGSHIECGICFEPYNEEHGTRYWECRQCLNRTHLECYRSWSSSDVGTTTCSYCRAVVPPLL